MAGLVATGCVSGSLASSTGPRPPGWQWSTARRQAVHVGEKVEFDFVLQNWRRQRVQPLGLADYCVARIGDERIEAEPNAEGQFRFAHTFTNVQPGDKVKVKATAYLQRGGRDYMKIRGQWIHADSPYEEPDRRFVGDSILLEVYEAPIELTLVCPPDELSPETGLLRIRRGDKATTVVLPERGDQPGFVMTGPEPDGYYRIVYVPRGDELNPTGTTEVEFVIEDVTGHRHETRTTLNTP